MIYIFPVIFDFTENDKLINISFPDLEEAYSCADTIEEAFKNASEVLKLTLRSRLHDSESIPVPSDILKLKSQLEERQIVSLIQVILENRVILDKKTLTIPHDINIAAIRAGINFSEVLSEALRKKLKLR